MAFGTLYAAATAVITRFTVLAALDVELKEAVLWRLTGGHLGWFPWFADQGLAEAGGILRIITALLLPLLTCSFNHLHFAFHEALAWFANKTPVAVLFVHIGSRRKLVHTELLAHGKWIHLALLRWSAAIGRR